MKVWGFFFFLPYLVGVGFGHVKTKYFGNSLILVLGPSLIFAHYKASIKSSIYTSIRQLYIPDIVSGPILGSHWYKLVLPQVIPDLVCFSIYIIVHTGCSLYINLQQWTILVNLLVVTR
jgi:hypothetical protein